MLERRASVAGSSTGTARAPAAGPGPTSPGGVVVVVFCHGWLNDPLEAREGAQRFFAHLRGPVDRHAERTTRPPRGRTARQPIKSLRPAWRTACKDAGRPGFLLHDLRRSAERNLERAGISRSVAMKLTGHKTEAVYRRYAIVAEIDLREAGTKLPLRSGTAAASPSLSDNLGDISVAARCGAFAK